MIDTANLSPALVVAAKKVKEGKISMAEFQQMQALDQKFEWEGPTAERFRQFERDRQMLKNRYHFHLLVVGAVVAGIGWLANIYQGMSLALLDNSTKRLANQYGILLIVARLFSITGKLVMTLADWRTLTWTSCLGLSIATSERSSPRSPWSRSLQKRTRSRLLGHHEAYRPARG
jgi:hypothetical protein